MSVRSHDVGFDTRTLDFFYVSVGANMMEHLHFTYVCVRVRACVRA